MYRHQGEVQAQGQITVTTIEMIIRKLTAPVLDSPKARHHLSTYRAFTSNHKVIQLELLLPGSQIRKLRHEGG